MLCQCDIGHVLFGIVNGKDSIIVAYATSYIYNASKSYIIFA